LVGGRFGRFSAISGEVSRVTARGSCTLAEDDDRYRE
jgi:hypothetical protein